jgi:hypothetical protein
MVGKNPFGCVSRIASDDPREEVKHEGMLSEGTNLPWTVLDSRRENIPTKLPLDIESSQSAVQENTETRSERKKQTAD